MKSPTETRKFNLRLPVDLMEEAQAQAEAMGVSLNAYCLLAIRNFIAYTERGAPRFTRQQRQAIRHHADEPQAAARLPSVRVGRNDPCPCGSGRKAKHCHPESC